MAYNEGIAPKPIMYDIDLDLIVSEYIETVEYNDISLESVLLRAKYAKKLSHVAYNSEDFLLMHHDLSEDFFNNLKMIQEIEDYFIKDHKEIKVFEDRVNKYLRFCEYMNCELNELEPVLSHNDLVADNFLKGTDGKFYIIDFETAGITKKDFIIGQLAVDAEIDWHVNGMPILPLEELYQRLNEIFDYEIPYPLFLARTLERFTQNVCYGYRQLSYAKNRKYSKEYITLKQKVIEYCTGRADKVLEVLEREIKDEI